MSTITSLELQCFSERIWKTYEQKMIDYQNGIITKEDFCESRINYKRELQQLTLEASRISFSKKSKTTKKSVKFNLDKNITTYYELEPEEITFKK